MGSRSISELASIIGKNTASLNDYLTTSGLPLPSFGVNESPNLPPLPEDVMIARNAALAASHELHCLLLGPTEHLLNSDGAHINMLSLQYIYHHRLAETFLPGEEATFEDIASTRGLDVVETRRFLRQAMTNHVFAEPRKGIVAHTASSRVLVDNPLATAWLGNTLENVWPSLPKVIEASEKWPDSEQPIHTGFALAHKTQLLPFEFIEQSPLRAKQFKDSMKFFQSSPGFEPIHLIEAFDFNSIGNGIVVDVGGSHGAVSIEIARKYPNLHCIVQDLPLAVKDAEADVPEDVRDRIQFMQHDYFQPQPVKDADVYYFRWIFHDWSDEYCIKILRSLIPALKSGARVVVNDVCLPEYGHVPLYMEKRVRMMDLTMKAFSNAKERDASDWGALFEAADSRYKMECIQRPPRSKMHMIVAIWSF